MKLKNIIAPLRQNLRKIISLGKYNPVNESGQRAIANELTQEGRRRLENFELNFPQSSPALTNNSLVEISHNYTFAPLKNLYPQYDKCDRNNPLGCDISLTTLSKAPAAKFCSRCGFPVQLAPNKEIRGKRGIYQVKSFLGRQENGRIYDAVNLNNGQSIIIKEYLLPRRCFTEATTREYKKELFTRVVNFQVLETTTSDFRVIIPLEGISDREQNRCYLIASSLAALPNLKTYLLHHGKMEQEKVIMLLEQVLQTLEFLHSQKWQFSSGEIRSGLVHGNLSLDSLLIRENSGEFFVYLWDFASWESIFNPQVKTISNQQEIDDLKALGNIGLYLLAETSRVIHNSYPLDPLYEENWSGINPEIKAFLRKLLGLNSYFANATLARKELPKIKFSVTPQSLPYTSLDPTEIKRKNIYLLPLIFLFIFLGLVAGIWVWKKKHSLLPQSTNFSGESCIKDLLNVPAGNFNYGILDKQNLTDIFQINPTYNNNCNPDLDTDSFLEIFQQIHQVNLTQTIFSDRDNLIKQINPRQINFAFLKVPSNQNEDRLLINNQEYIYKTLAYDGLLVYVPFVGCQETCAELGNYLNQKITLEQLRGIYTTKIKYWSQINPQIPNNIEIQVFAPKDQFALELFKQLVFAEHEAELVFFESAIASGKIQQLDHYQMLKTMRNLWLQGTSENGIKKGAIGFHFQDKVYKQCNVYPLAVVNNDTDFYPLLIKQDGTGVDLFRNLSCQDNKPQYQLNEQVFRTQQYPLAFTLNLLYLNSNKQQNLELAENITAILQTKEFQCHLAHKKFIPLELSQQECQQ